MVIEPLFLRIPDAAVTAYHVRPPAEPPERMSGMGEIIATGPVWLWNPGKGSWHFFNVPPEQAVEIKLATVGMRGGFGSVKVTATIGHTCWQTSIFPDGKSGGFVLPIKAAVRKAEDIAAGDIVTVHLSF